MQAAFKRASASSISSNEADSGAPGVDWANVKPENRTLVHQASPVLRTAAYVSARIAPVLSCRHVPHPVPRLMPCLIPCVLKAASKLLVRLCCMLCSQAQPACELVQMVLNRVGIVLKWADNEQLVLKHAGVVQVVLKRAKTVQMVLKCADAVLKCTDNTQMILCMLTLCRWYTRVPLLC